jgi:hypothetical protein
MDMWRTILRTLVVAAVTISMSYTVGTIGEDI